LDSQQEEEAEAADGIASKSARRVVTLGWVMLWMHSLSGATLVTWNNSAIKYDL
jgi:hypothetical protein